MIYIAKLIRKIT